MDHLAISKLTAKFQTTIPKSIRDVLHLKPKDQIIYEILDNHTVVILKAIPLDNVYLSVGRAFNEWNSAEDEKAYKDL